MRGGRILFALCIRKKLNGGVGFAKAKVLKPPMGVPIMRGGGFEPP